MQKTNTSIVQALQEIKGWPSASQVAKRYSLARQSVVHACKSGRFTESEAIETTLGWLISPVGAERLWKDRVK